MRIQIQMCPGTPSAILNNSKSVMISSIREGAPKGALRYLSIGTDSEPVKPEGMRSIAAVDHRYRSARIDAFRKIAETDYQRWDRTFATQRDGIAFESTNLFPCQRKQKVVRRFGTTAEQTGHWYLATCTDRRAGSDATR